MLIKKLFTLSIVIFHYWTVFHGPETTVKKFTVNFRTLSIKFLCCINFCVAESNFSTFTAVHRGRRKLNALLQIHSPDITKEKRWRANIEEENKSIKCDGKRRDSKPARSYAGYFHSIWETNGKDCFLPFPFLTIFKHFSNIIFSCWRVKLYCCTSRMRFEHCRLNCLLKLKPKKKRWENSVKEEPQDIL